MDDLFFFLHIAGVVISFISILLADRQGFAWFRGETLILEESKVAKAHKFVWFGLVVTIVSGFFAFWDKRFYLFESPAFIIKMFFVVALTINGFFIGHLMKLPCKKAFKDITLKERAPLFISGAISGISWAGAFILAFFL